MSFEHHLSQLKMLLDQSEFEQLKVISETLLKLDPNNSELLNFRFIALKGLGIETKDIGFLRKFCWYRSLDHNAFYALYLAYLEQDDKFNALVALAYCLSVTPDYAVGKQSLSTTLMSLGATSLKISFLTVDRVGHLICEPESWIRSRKKTNTAKKVLNLFVADVAIESDIANLYIYGLLKEHIRIVENPFLHKLFRSRPNLISDYFYEPMPFDLQSHKKLNNKKPWPETDYLLLQNIQRLNPPKIAIPKSDERAGIKALSELGIKDFKKIVCFHVRDGAYLSEKIESKNCSYHDFRDADINTFKLAVNYLLDKGYTVIRVGLTSHQFLDIKHPAYYDFCKNKPGGLNGFIETFVLSICSFFIANTSGPQGVAAAFDRPILGVNMVPFGLFYPYYSRFIPKYYFNKETNQRVKFISLLEGIKISRDSGISIDILECMDGNVLRNNGFECIDNSEGEILAAVVEFEQLVVSDELIRDMSETHKRYIEKIPARDLKNGSMLVSECFLKANRHLFDL
ncbi:TIGR04372 family glycosyltransferase [Paraglaciecola sp. 25GB23A]|uniref:TIGR04372 family glycosyltransferase n=1 Tax=Paraglaciecola sp. 25GB23A TaxID=3156068 RepID=UPI0032B01D0D